MATWIQKSPRIAPGGDISKAQCGDSHSVRFVNRDDAGKDEHAMLTITLYVEDLDIDQDGLPENKHRYGVRRQVEYLRCTDLEDPGTSERWSEYDYDTLHDGQEYATEDEAQKVARREAERCRADDINWDGLPFQQ